MSLRSLRQELLARSDLQGEAFCTAFSAAADQWLTGLLEQATEGNPSGIVLVAVGGYGRGELCPYSDLDVVLVHKGRRDIGRVADAVWYPVWDEGIRLDHSVRRPAEVLEVARGDLRAQLGLLDGRVVAGDSSVAEPMLAAARDQWRAHAAQWLPVLAAQVDERHRTHGDVAFLLEPDLKEAHGGLRDVHAVRAASLAVAAVAEQVDLRSLSGPRATLTGARVELHRSTGRATDRLLLQEQDQVAAVLRYRDADALMASIAEAGRTIAWVTDDVWRRRSTWPTSRRRRRLWPARGATPANAEGAAIRVPVETGIALEQVGENGTSGEVVLEPGTDHGRDPALTLRVAAVAAEKGLPIGRASLDAMAAGAPHPPDPWSSDMRGALVRVLATGPAAIPALEALDQYGLLVALLPEWSAVRNRPQRNAYHRFTVDRHLLEAAAQAAALASRVDRPDLLLVGALLHDVGKGFPGDHTDAGVRVVGDMARRMGFAPEDVAVLTGLVRNHLLLSEVATRRDLDDPATIETVAAAVHDRSQLDLLAALTEGDSLATGPAAWGQWKAGLVADLVRRVTAYLASGEVRRATPLVSERHRGFMRQVERLGRSVVAAEVPTVTVVARDRPGLLSSVAGVFALRGLDVRSADVAGEDGFAVETFVVEPSRGRWPDFKLVADELEAVLRGTFPLEERLAEQVRAYADGRRSVSPRPVEVRVSVDNAASAGSSVVEVRAEDDAGLLHRITAALFALDLDVVAARVSTFGHEVVDAFYVRDTATGGKVTDPVQIERVRDGVVRAINTSTTRPARPT
ncbi:MAG TPA: [protein-PII] uridylyltransferase [Acidimicrobiales bacterium]|nr:[protein-PII] uridylyltransferase [Acidimicrobiales bacterium]